MKYRPLICGATISENRAVLDAEPKKRGKFPQKCIVMKREVATLEEEKGREKNEEAGRERERRLGRKNGEIERKRVCRPQSLGAIVRANGLTCKRACEAFFRAQRETDRPYLRYTCIRYWDFGHARERI